jgi:hypothetical protein
VSNTSRPHFPSCVFLYCIRGLEGVLLSLTHAKTTDPIYIQRHDNLTDPAIRVAQTMAAKAGHWVAQVPERRCAGVNCQGAHMNIGNKIPTLAPCA